MPPRRSLGLPITLAIVMITLLAVLAVGWILVVASRAMDSAGYAGIYWALLSIGTTFMVLLIVGVVLYLVLSIKAINLNRRQSNFIDSVTHELKSPIASLKLYLQTLNRREVTRDEQAGFYRFMLEDVERLDHLINQMLDAGQLDTAPDNDDREDVALDELLQQCADAVCLRYRVPRSTVSHEMHADTDGRCVVRARRVDLDMIFRNLLDNAVKYAGSPPKVEVSVGRTSDGRTVTLIADNGRGIPPKMRRKIFGRFVRLGLELEREKPGTGLGLYIVRTLVRRLRGRIRVRDRDSVSGNSISGSSVSGSSRFGDGGPGTVFEVQLPGTPTEQTEKESDDV